MFRPNMSLPNSRYSTSLLQHLPLMVIFGGCDISKPHRPRKPHSKPHCCLVHHVAAAPVVNMTNHQPVNNPARTSPSSKRSPPPALSEGAVGVTSSPRLVRVLIYLILTVMSNLGGRYSNMFLVEAKTVCQYTCNGAIWLRFCIGVRVCVIVLLAPLLLIEFSFLQPSTVLLSSEHL